MEELVIVTPAKNEAKYIRQTIESFVQQSVLPKEWIIVDDGSTDKTCSIIEEYLPSNKWIKLIKNNKYHENRSGGAKVVQAFEIGYKNISASQYDFIGKFDADIVLPKDYFQKILAEFRDNQSLGLCGGQIFNKFDDKLVLESSANYHVRGALKLYRRLCFEQIDGYSRVWNWDGLDEMKAMHIGWNSYSINIPVIHLRPTSSSYNPYRHAYKSGYEARKMRSSFFLTVIRSVSRLFHKPFLLNSFLYLCGYLIAIAKKEPFHIDKDLGRFINSFHKNRIFKRT